MTTAPLTHFFDGDALDKDALNAIVDNAVNLENAEPAIVFVNRISKKVGKTSAGQKMKIVAEVVPIVGAASGKWGDRQAVTIAFAEPFGTTSPAVVAIPFGTQLFMSVLYAVTPTTFTVAIAQDPATQSATVQVSAILYIAVGFA